MTKNNTLIKYCVIIIVIRKNNFAEVAKNLAIYKFENNFVGPFEIFSDRFKKIILKTFVLSLDFGFYVWDQNIKLWLFQNLLPLKIYSAYILTIHC